jgi:hypothetical protein
VRWALASPWSFWGWIWSWRCWCTTPASLADRGGEGGSRGACVLGLLVWRWWGLVCTVAQLWFFVFLHLPSLAGRGGEGGCVGDGVLRAEAGRRRGSSAAIVMEVLCRVSFSSSANLRPVTSTTAAGRALKVMLGFAAATAFQGAGSSEPLFGDFPAVEGLAPDQSVKRSNGSGAPPTRLGRRRRWVPEGPCCFFFRSLGLFVSLKLW